MKVALISTYDTNGGAGIACYRLYEALKNNSSDEVNLLVDRKYGTDENVHVISGRRISKFNAFLRFSWERLCFLKKARSKKVLYQYSPANVGKDISQHPVVQQADILHLHWVHFGFLSLESIKKLVELNKPIVWTLHDMWAFTGGCHYAGACRNFEKQCGNCPYLRHPHPYDLSFKVNAKKKELFQNANITFVTCSQWLGNEARKSSLLANQKILSINNPINLAYFKPGKKEESRKRLGLSADKYYLACGAANVQDKRKGLVYLKEALKLFANRIEDTQNIELLIFGKAEEEFFSALPFGFHIFGNLSSNSDTLLEVYQASDVFVLPSLQDNFPNTILEAMACGIPCLAFDVGGIPEMIYHKQNGHLAQYKDSQSLAEGLLYFYQHPAPESFSEKARHRATLCSYQEIAKRYFEVYQDLKEIEL